MALLGKRWRTGTKSDTECCNAVSPVTLQGLLIDPVLHCQPSNSYRATVLWHDYKQDHPVPTLPPQQCQQYGTGYLRPRSNKFCFVSPLLFHSKLAVELWRRSSTPTLSRVEQAWPPHHTSQHFRFTRFSLAFLKDFKKLQSAFSMSILYFSSVHLQCT